VPALEGLYNSQGCLQPIEGLTGLTRIPDFLPN
jgi:hypothetical protein